MEGSFVIGISGDDLDALDEYVVSKNLGMFPVFGPSHLLEKLLGSVASGVSGDGANFPVRIALESIAHGATLGSSGTENRYNRHADCRFGLKNECELRCWLGRNVPKMLSLRESLAVLYIMDGICTIKE